MKFVCVRLNECVPYHAARFRNDKWIQYYYEMVYLPEDNNFWSYILEILKLFHPEITLQIGRVLNVT